MTKIAHLFVAANLIVGFILQASGQSAPLPAPATTLEEGTPVKLRIGRTVSSADAQVGDTVDFEVLEEVRVGNLLVIPKGGTAWATVTEAESKKRMARGGKLNMNIDSVRLVDGEKAALRAVKDVKGGGHTGAMTGGIVATAIVFWPAAPFFLFMHGKDITIPKGTEITAYINGNFPIDAAKFQNSSPTPQAANPTQVVPASQSGAAINAATLEISSSPPGADIEIDGGFCGSTPSTLGIAVGEHNVKVSKKGYTPWERKIRSSSGNVHIVAELEPAVTPTTAPTSTSPPPPSTVTQQVAASVSQTVAAVSPPESATATQLRPALMVSTQAQPRAAKVVS